MTCRRLLAGAAAVVLLVAGCGSDADPVEPTASAESPTAAVPEPVAEVADDVEVQVDRVDDLFPVVVGAEATQTGDTAWTVAVTLISEYDTPERYADAWRVLDAEDNELGIRVLLHDHASEQPFTRSTGVDIPADVDAVFIEGRDQVNGWSGQRFELVLSRS